LKKKIKQFPIKTIIPIHNLSSDIILYIIALEDCSEITFLLNMFTMNLKVLERHLLTISSAGDKFVRAVAEVLIVAVLADCKSVLCVV
jgi:hypothetical protein